MNLRVIREPSVKGATLGALYVNDVWQCWTLEDELREVPGQPVKAWKVPAQTAIPAGRYRILLTDSARFHRVLPLLVDVPGFTGVRIHSGNAIHDTEGCLLVGRTRRSGWIGESRLAFDALFARLVAGAGEAWITVENPPSYRREAA